MDKQDFDAIVSGDVSKCAGALRRFVEQVNYSIYVDAISNALDTQTNKINN